MRETEMGQIRRRNKTYDEQRNNTEKGKKK